MHRHTHTHMHLSHRDVAKAAGPFTTLPPAPSHLEICTHSHPEESGNPPVYQVVLTLNPRTEPARFFFLLNLSPDVCSGF